MHITNPKLELIYKYIFYTLILYYSFYSLLVYGKDEVSKILPANLK